MPSIPGVKNLQNQINNKSKFIDYDNEKLPTELLDHHQNIADFKISKTNNSYNFTTDPLILPRRSVVQEIHQKINEMECLDSNLKLNWNKMKNYSNLNRKKP